MNTNETTKMTVTEVTNPSAERAEMGWDDPAILREDTKKAKAHSKEFIKNNRTRKIVISSNAMNEYDEKDGKWKTIDNTLVEKENEYESRLGKFKAKIKKSEKRRGVEVIGDGMMLSWEFLGREKDGEKTEDDEKHEKKKPSLKVTPKKKNFARGSVESNAKYENCEDDLDIEYVLQSNNIKENIIIRKKEDSYRYRFAFSLEGLTMRLAEDQNSLEVFSCATDENGVPCEKREFTIPAPFMFDKAGARSDEVQFELEETDAGKYTFTVVANENWINDANRTFPVTIDPQIQVNEFELVSVTQIYRRFHSDSSGSGSGSSNTETEEISKIENATQIKTGRSDGVTVETQLIIDRNKIIPQEDQNQFKTKMISLYLILTTDTDQYLTENDLNNFSLDGHSPEWIDETHVRFNILPSYNSSTTFVLNLLPGSENGLYLFQKDVSLEMEYATQSKDRPIQKSFSLVGGAEYVVDLQNKNPVTVIPDRSEDCGISISHVYKIDSNAYCYGANFHLNLNEKLKKQTNENTNAEYIFTDALGDVYYLNNVFYYLDNNGIKQTVKKGNVTVKPDGSLYFVKDETTYPVFKEAVTDSGWEAITELDGVDDLEFFDQRSDKLKQLEEAKEHYQKTLDDIVCAYLNEEDQIVAQEKPEDSAHWENSDSTNSNVLFLTKNEVITYNWLWASKINTSPNQLAIIEAQIQALKLKSDDNRKIYNEYSKELIIIQDKITFQLLHESVNYLRKDSVIKGFNTEGDLVAIIDNYGNYHNIFYDKRTVNGKEYKYITHIIDSNEKETVFNYNSSLQLISICTPNGNRTEYTYAEHNFLRNIAYSDGTKLTLDYSLDQTICKIDSSENVCAMITDMKYDINHLSDGFTISVVSKAKNIAHNSIIKDDESMSNIEVKYTTNKTTITDEYGNWEIFIFDTNPDCLKEFYSIIDGKVASAEKYTYSDNDFDIVEYAHNGSLNLREYSGYTFIPDKCTCTYYDDYRRVIREESSWKRSTISVAHPKVITNHTYDDAHHLSKSVSEIYHAETSSPAYLSVTTYQYNDKGSLIRKKNYVEGKQLTEGIVVEEHEYDDKGHEVKTITYNTLDASSKFYTEKEYDEDEKLIAEPDATGEHKTRYDYSANDGSLRSELLPNGSKFAYGYDASGNLTAVSQSTEDGEENCNNTVYTYDIPTEVTSGNNTVRYTYDHKRRITAVDLNGVENYATISYQNVTFNGNKAEKTTTTLNGSHTSYLIKDHHGNILQTNNGKASTTFEYDSKNNLVSVHHRANGSLEDYGYDSLDNLASYRYNDGSSDRVTESYTYNSDHQLVSKAVTSNGTTQTYTYSYKDDTAKSLDSITLGSYKFAPKTDCLGRNRGKTISVSNSKIAEEQITYLKFGDHATNIPATIYYGDKKNGSYAFSDHFKYKYDSMGNITEVRENGELYVKYAYDTIGRLVREDNKKLGKTNVYTYDTNGNILCRKECAFTLIEAEKLDELEYTTFAYAYDGDKLLSYDGEQCIYDTIGNPEKHRGITAVWENGRQLSSYGNTTFTYDNLGTRTEKNTLAFTYDSNGNLIHQSNGISFIYDASGVCGLIHSGATYFYRKDILGNIIALLNTNGEIVATYTYDAWGKHTITDANGNVITSENHIANLNPFRYRGYYYDTETKLYYLQTRYYDPETGRFITIDDISYLDPDSINGLNLYAYCRNNPVMCVDPDGHMPKWLKWLIGGVAFVGAVALTVLTGGALAPVFIGMGVSILSGAIIQGSISAYNGGSFWDGFWNGAADGALWGGIFALGGSVIRTVKMFKNGVALGENMTRVTRLAKQGGQITYNGMPGYKMIRFLAGENTARVLSMEHNKAFIERMMRWGVKLVDYGFDLSRPNRSWYYLMETIVSYGYKSLEIKF